MSVTVITRQGEVWQAAVRLSDGSNVVVGYRADPYDAAQLALRAAQAADLAGNFAVEQARADAAWDDREISIEDERVLSLDAARYEAEQVGYAANLPPPNIQALVEAWG